MKPIKIIGPNIKDLPFMDPSIKWYVQTSLNHSKIIRGAISDPSVGTITNNGIMYSCDDAICVPRHFAGYMHWYSPSANGLGNRMFDLQEAWDHEKWRDPNTTAPYDGKSIWIPGYGGYFNEVPLTDKTDKVHVFIIRRYIDDTILIYNTGKYADTVTNINVTVNDPPSELGYKIDTNGTRANGATKLEPGQYALFYKGATPPQVDTANGVFQVSPFGSTKSQPYELWVNSGVIRNTIIPKMYLGVKAPGRDMEVVTNVAYPGVYAAGGGTVVMAWFGGQETREYRYGTPEQAIPRNVSRLINEIRPNVWIYKDDPNTVTWAEGFMNFLAWLGWGEDDAGNVKFILLSHFSIGVDTNFNEKIRKYTAYIYDVDRDEAYGTYIIKPTVNTYSYGEAGNVIHPLFMGITNTSSHDASMFAYIDANDNWRTIKDASTVDWDYHDNAYGFCNYHGNGINCAEGLGIYSDDPNYTPPAPKSAFGAGRYLGQVGGGFPRVPSLGDRTLYAGRVYAVVNRMKSFPLGTAEADLQNWFKSLQPKSFTSTDFNAMLGVLPGSFWLFGQNTDTQSMTLPSSVNPGSQFTVNISNANKPNTQAWIAIIDQKGNIVASASGNTDASGNTSITLTAPTTAGRYKVRAIVKGSRQLI